MKKILLTSIFLILAIALGFVIGSNTQTKSKRSLVENPLYIKHQETNLVGANAITCKFTRSLYGTYEQNMIKYEIGKEESLITETYRNFSDSELSDIAYLDAAQSIQEMQALVLEDSASALVLLVYIPSSKTIETRYIDKNTGVGMYSKQWNLLGTSPLARTTFGSCSEAI